MTEEEIALAVEILAKARRSKSLIEALNITPGSVAEAHAIQDRVMAGLGEMAGGFKANAPPCQPSERGLIYRPSIFDSPARIPATVMPHRGVEGEIAFRFLRDLRARDTDYSRAAVVDAIVALPAIEVVSGRISHPFSRPPLEQLADCLNNGALVLGAERPHWRQLDTAALKVSACVNNKSVASHIGGHPINDPVGVVVVLVNMMRNSGGVRAGQVVTTGSCTGIHFLQPGDYFSVTFEGLGSAEVLFD